MSPKVFISYSWSSSGHQKRVKDWTDQLIAEGIDAVIDLYDLKEGQDKNAFMERLVTDQSIDHVIIFSEKSYMEKANSRKAGVGTESQIISNEVYQKIQQSKFLPVVCEFDEDGNPYLPTYLKHTIWIDFSTSENVNKNWEQLVRAIYGKPIYEKPELGSPPIYITSDLVIPTSHILRKFDNYKQAILQEKNGINLYRSEYLDSCLKFADKLRIRERPEVSSLGEMVYEDAKKLILVRNHIIDWVILESSITQELVFSEILINFLERLRELKSRPPELNSWNQAWFEAHSIFVYETFLYIIAALIRNQAFQVLHEIFSTHYIIPSVERSQDKIFNTFDTFLGFSETLQAVLAPQGQRLFSPVAEFIKNQSDREDLPFKSIIEADLLILLMACLEPNSRWYPQTLHYASWIGGESPFFLRSTQHSYFKKLAIITGIEDANELREKVKDGYERLGVNRWQNFHFLNFWSLMNMDKLDSLK